MLFDPGRKVLKTVSFNKTFEEWSAQALHAHGMIDRYDALVALQGFPAEQKEATLLQAWENEKYHLPKNELLKQLFAGENKFYDEIFLEALNDDDPLVRRAALENTGQVTENLKEETEKLLTDHSYINVEKALDLLCRSFPHDIPRYLETTKNETGWRGMNIRMKWLEIAIQAEQREYLPEIVQIIPGRSYEFETRMNAFQLLKRLNYLDKRSALNLIDGYLYWNYKVSNAAKEVLQYFYQQNRFKLLIENAIAGSRFSDDEKDKIEQMLAGK